MREIIEDILKYTYSLGFIPDLKITGTDDDTLIEAMDEQCQVVIKGHLKTPEENFIGEFGISNLPILKSLVDYADFKSDAASFDVVRETRGDTEFVSNFKFSAPGVSPFKHNLMDPKLIREHYDFVGGNWNITFTPDKNAVGRFGYMANTYSGTNSNFTVSTEDDNLLFSVGGYEGGGSVIMHSEAGTSLKSTPSWPVSPVLAVLKLKDDPTVNILDGRTSALCIELESKFAKWSYIFPSIKQN